MKKFLVCMIVIGSVSLGFARDTKNEGTEKALEACQAALNECAARGTPEGCKAGLVDDSGDASFVCSPTFNAPTRFVRCQNTKHGEKCNNHFYLKAQ